MSDCTEPALKRAKTSDSQEPWKLLTAWFCPYAQRAWIALNHHKVPFERVEAMKLKIPEGKLLKDAVAYDKDAILLKHHPSGLVPTIVDREEAGPAIYDSLVCVEFADDLASSGQVQGSSPLLPTDPLLRARARIWASWMDKNFSSPFYTVLVPKEHSLRLEGLSKLLSGMRAFQANIKGKFFLGDEISIVDITVFPWAFRIFSCNVIGVYRPDPEFAIDRAEFQPLLAWLDRCKELEAVQATLADKQALTDTYYRYADGTAESKVGEAVRAGKSADQHD